MKTLLRHIAVFALLCLLWACGGGDRALQSALDRADALMEERPDSALDLLKPYDGAEIRSEEQRARFALLYSMALHKNFIDEQNDSLINIAYEYYGRKSDSRDAMLSTYYKGYINMNARRFDRAAVLALESLEKAEQLKDTLFMARSYELLGLIEYENYLMEESLSQHRKAAEYYKAVGKNRNHLGALNTAALALEWLGHRDQSIQLLDSIRQQAWALGDTTLALESSADLIPVLLKNGNPEPEITDKEIASLEGYESVYSDYPRTFAFLALHRLYKGDLQGCDSLLRKARNAVSAESEKASILSVEAERAKRAGDYQLESELTDSMLRLQSSVVRNLFKREITKAERDFMAAQSKRAEAEKRKTRIALWLSLAGVLILGFITVIVVRIIIRRRNEKIENLLKEILLLSECPVGNEVASAGNRSNPLAELLFASHNKAIEALCQLYYRGMESDVEILQVKEHLDSVVENLRSEETMNAIKEYVNSNFDSILDDISKKAPRIKESDLNLIALIKAGLSPVAISIMLGLKRQSFYSRRSRLIEKLSQSGISL